MQPLKISVVTVSYNAAATIEETILSVVDQTYNNIEYIVIDGGSIDGTVDIIKRYAEGGCKYGKHNNFISYWVSEPDKGIYDAMNKGIAAATGDYIYFIGGDDLVFDDKIFQKVSSYINSNRSDVFYGDVVFQPIGKRYAGKFSKWKLAHKNICHQAIFYPLYILKKYLYDLKYPVYADYYENLILWHLGIKFNYMPLNICNFSIEGTSNNGDIAFNKMRSALIKSYLGFLPWSCYRLKDLGHRLFKGRTSNPK